MIGRIERPRAHVHFSEARWGRYLNPLRPGAMGPYLDRHAPTITAVEVERRGSAIQKTRVSGTVNLIAECSIPRPPRCRPPWAGLPVMPALIHWRIIGPAGAVTRWSTAVDFRREIPPASAFGHVYAGWTRQNHARQPGR